VKEKRGEGEKRKPHKTKKKKSKRDFRLERGDTGKKTHHKKEKKKKAQGEGVGGNSWGYKSSMHMGGGGAHKGRRVVVKKRT